MATDRAWLRGWLRVTSIAAVALTAIDAVLLQRKRSYFTGGFLSVDHVRGVVDGVGFFLTSLVADVAAMGVLTAFALWAAGRLRLSRRLSAILAVAIGLGPFLIADLITYQLLTYLGDAFDFALMFQLVGRNPEEIVAVTSEHLWQLAKMIGLALIILAALGWAVLRWGRNSATAIERVSFIGALVIPFIVWTSALVGLVAVRRASDVLDNGLRRKPTARMLGVIADTLSDVDRDGFGILGKPTDPAPFNGAIHPYATEIPGNDIDDNGVGGDLPVAGNGPRVADTTPRFSTRPNVILIVLESFRADLLGMTLNGKPVTPVLNALAARGVSARAYSHNGYTAQSRFHILTGALDAPPGATTLLDDFKANGYETAYFSAQDESFGGKDLEIGFTKADVAFDARQDVDSRYTVFKTPGSLGLPFDVLNGHIGKFLESRRRERPLFMYVNYYDTHFPYWHRKMAPLVSDVALAQFEIGPNRAADLRAMYANTAANVDAAIGVMLERATATLGSPPVVVVTADHGESLFDEGFLGHGYALNEVQTRIPLVIAGASVRLEEPVGQSDIRAALLHGLAGTGGSPVATPSALRSVFQYLGTIEGPAQIGRTGVASQLIYDFRTHRARAGSAIWQRPDRLTPEDASLLRELVHEWERMVVGRRHSISR
jgi:hypothetical protein